METVLFLHDLMLRASLALGLGELDYVVATTHHILQYFPGHLRARVLFGQALLDRSRYEDAEEQFEAVILLDPENVMARAGLAAAMERQGRLKGAIEQLTRAVDCEPGNREGDRGTSGAAGLGRRRHSSFRCRTGCDTLPGHY